METLSDWSRYERQSNEDQIGLAFEEMWKGRSVWWRALEVTTNQVKVNFVLRPIEHLISGAIYKDNICNVELDPSGFVCGNQDETYDHTHIQNLIDYRVPTELFLRMYTSFLRNISKPFMGYLLVELKQEYILKIQVKK